MNDHHPTDSAIAASITGDAHDQAIVQHLASCAQCRSIAARLGDDPLDDLPDVPLPNDSAVVPSATAVAAADARPVDLAVDQIWRAAAPGGSMVLCWIRRLRSDGRPAVVPVSFDPDHADNYSLIVPADRSPLGVDTVFHTTVETTIDTRSLSDCIVEQAGVTDDIDIIRSARTEGRPAEGVAVGSPIVSLTDERIEYRQQLADSLIELTTPRFEPDDSDEDSRNLVDALSTDSALGALIDDEITAELTDTLVNGLRDAYPAARVLPVRPTVDTAGGVSLFATIVNIDVFVTIATVTAEIPDEAIPELSRTVFETDMSIQAVCFVTAPGAQDAQLVDRRSLTENYVTPSGDLRLPEDSLKGHVTDVLLKYFDLRINPFRAFEAAAVEPIRINYRDLAVEFGAGAVRDTADRASSLRVPGKADGYRRVTDHREAVIEIVEQALTRNTVDISAILEGEA